MSHTSTPPAVASVASGPIKEGSDSDKKLRTTSINYLADILDSKLPSYAEISAKIENEIYNVSNLDKEINVQMYCMNLVKVMENLKIPHVITCINNETLKPEAIVTLDKDDLNPDKWQILQDIRLPKHIKKERVRGLNKCPKCHSWYSEYTTAQTRSSDEPSTLFFFCVDCEHRWKM